MGQNKGYPIRTTFTCGVIAEVAIVGMGCWFPFFINGGIFLIGPGSHYEGRRRGSFWYGSSREV